MDPSHSESKRLFWVQKNRKSRPMPQLFGEIMGPYIKRREFTPSAWQCRVHDLLQEFAGNELLDQIQAIGVGKQRVTLHVKNAALCYHLRLRWEQAILEYLRNQLPGSGITDVQFVVAKAGQQDEE